ncbi:hypothetical protein HAX54_026603, partial [Datura stramonium]|nr:hypothetical protein [Datura stramonium]
MRIHYFKSSFWKFDAAYHNGSTISYKFDEDHACPFYLVQTQFAPPMMDMVQGTPLIAPYPSL